MLQKSNALGDELEARLGELLTDLFDLGVVAGLQCQLEEAAGDGHVGVGAVMHPLRWFLPMSDFCLRSQEIFRHAFVMIFLVLQPFRKVSFFHNRYQCTVL